MKTEEQVPLSTLTTLKIGGPARYSATIESLTDLEASLTFTRERGLPFVVIGEGSNVLAQDDTYEGVVLLMRMRGINTVDDGEVVLVTASAGESWDAVVKSAAELGLWGIENLAGIPGTIGAAPVQNIGAYGAELSGVLESVEAYNASTGALETLTNSECHFGYRDSRFKHEPNLIITSVTLKLAKNGNPKIEYADLRARKEQGVDLQAPPAIGKAVREVRKAKFPDLAEYGTAGSFFKNPILSSEQFSHLTDRFGAMPSFPVTDGVKIPLAFILDKILGLRGYRLGPTFLFGNQPLVLVAEKGATALDVEALAHDIEERVLVATGIRIEREVHSLSFHEYKK